jgi:hypothetical protein
MIARVFPDAKRRGVSWVMGGILSGARGLPLAMATLVLPPGPETVNWR